MNILVSIIVACYNQGKYLAETIKSVINQTYPHWECIIINDGSTDNSEEIAFELLKNDNRITYYKISNSGVSFVRNYGIEKSRGYYILPLDGDDKIHETYIEKAVKVHQHNNVKLVYCEAELFGLKEGRFKVAEYSRAELAKMNMIFSSAVFKKDTFLASGGYNVNMEHGWEDWDLWISFLKNGGNVYKIPEVLFFYRIKDQSRTKSLEGVREQKTFMQLYLNHPDFFDQYYSEPIEIFPQFKDLKDYNQTLLEHINFLKGIIKLKPASYMSLLKKINNKLAK